LSLSQIRESGVGGRRSEVRGQRSEGGALGRSVASSLSHKGKGLAGTCPVCGEVRDTGDGWHATWVREGFDLEKDICEECLMKLELPLLREDGAFLGALWLVKDLKREPVTHYTLRRIEHLRRTLIATLANLQSADSADSRRLRKGR